MTQIVDLVRSGLHVFNNDEVRVKNQSLRHLEEVSTSILRNIGER